MGSLLEDILFVETRNNKEVNGCLSCVTVESPCEPKLKRVFEELPFHIRCHCLGIHPLCSDRTSLDRRLGM